MSYCGKADIETQIGSELLARLSDRDSDGEGEDEVVTLAIDGAAATINSYLSVRYDLPLTEAQQTPILKAYCMDIAIYRMALDGLAQTAEMRQRYEDAIAHLKRIADGKANLGVETVDDPGADPDDGQADTGSDARILTVQRG